MESMIKNIALIVVSVVLILLIAAIVGVYLFANNAVKTYVEAEATKKLNVPVDIGKLSISPFAGALEIERLSVANPSDYEHEYLLTIGQINTDVELMSLTSDTVKIYNLVLERVEVIIEQKGLSTNLQQVIESIEKPAEEPEKKEKYFIINNLEINDIKVKAKLLPIPGKDDTITFDPKPIKMTDLGTDKKMTIDELTELIVKAIAVDIAETGTDFLPKDLLENMRDMLGETTEEIFDTGKGILEGGKEALEGILK